MDEDCELSDVESDSSLSIDSLQQTGTNNAGPLAPLEALPTELLHQIASKTHHDLDLHHLMLSSPVLAAALVPDSSNVWRKKFLALYDHPFISDSKEFAVAYKLRHFVMRNFISCSDDQHDKHRVQLDMIRDLVLETYNRPTENRPYATTSKNLAVLASPDHNPWVYTFLSSALYGNRNARYGSSNTLHDSLQVLLSHLVLSPRSPLARKITTTRDNYDLTRVYLFNQPLRMLITRQNQTAQTTRLKSDTHYKVDMHTILHIRNFWHRHMIDDTQATSENTYVSMMTELDKIGKTPQAWESPLHQATPLATRWYGHYSTLSPWPRNRKDLDERQSNAEDWETVDPRMLDLEVSSTNTDEVYWPSLFSSIPAFAESMPDAKNTEKLHVEYFRGIAPFVDLSQRHRPSQDTSSRPDDVKDVKWHPFKAARVHGVTHDIPPPPIAAREPHQSSERKRGSGPSSDYDHLPGWKHIMMIMYMPTLQYLVSVLEYAQENYGGSINAQLSTMFGGADSEDGSSDEGDDGDNTSADASSDVSMHENTPDSETDGPTEEQIQQGLQKLLDRRIREYTKTYFKSAATETHAQPSASGPAPAPQSPQSSLPPHNTSNTINHEDNKKSYSTKNPLFSPSHIRSLHDSHTPSALLTWPILSYAYAYEGLLTPNSKLIFGRYWRVHGIDGLGAAREVNPDGVGVDVRRVGSDRTAHSSSSNNDQEETSDEEGSRNRKKRKRTKREMEYEFVHVVNGIESRAQNGCKGLERGPFVFWAG